MDVLYLRIYLPYLLCNNYSYLVIKFKKSFFKFDKQNLIKTIKKVIVFIFPIYQNQT